jgi:hypothetical protein
MEKVYVSATLRKDIKTRAEEAVKNGTFAGINNVSSLIELALDKLLSNPAA